MLTCALGGTTNPAVMTVGNLSSPNCNTQARKHAFSSPSSTSTRHRRVHPGADSVTTRRARARQNGPVDAADTTPHERHETPATPESLTVVAALLAGGAGARFADSDGTHKLAARLVATATEPAESVFERALRHVRGAGIGPIVIVTGSWSPTPSRSATGRRCDHRRQPPVGRRPDHVRADGARRRRRTRRRPQSSSVSPTSRS